MNFQYLPYRTNMLFAPGAIDPRQRRGQFLVFCTLTVAFAIVSSVLPGGGWRWFIGYLVVGASTSWLLIKGIDAMRRYSDPEATRLSETKDGRLLLKEGEDLYERRERLEEDHRSRFPVLSTEKKREMTSDQAQIGSYALAMDEQLRLERDLRERQDRLLDCP